MGNDSATIPVQRLGAIAATQYLDHLLALPPEDARLRFGSAISAETIRKYVEGIDFDSDEVFGVYGDGLTLVGAAHLAFDGDEAAELGVSVLPGQRGRSPADKAVASPKPRTATSMHPRGNVLPTPRLARSYAMPRT